MTSSSPYPPDVPRHCSNVPVLFELLKGEEEQCRVWLRDEMKQIPDTLIDSLFGRFIMSSTSLLSAVPQSRLTVSELCELLEGEKVETRMVLRSEMDRLVNTLFERLTNNLRTNEDLGRSEDGGERAQLVDTLDRVESANAIPQQPSSLIAQPSTSSLNPVAHRQHSNGDEMELNTVEIIEIKEEVEDGEETRVIDIADLVEDSQGGGGDGSRSVENGPMDWVKQEIKEEFEDEEMLDIKEEEEDSDETYEAIDNEVGGGESGENANTETTQQVDHNEPEIKGEFDYGQEIEIKQEQEEDDEDEATNIGEMMEIKKEEDEEDSGTRIIDIEGLTKDNQSGDDSAQMVDLLDQIESLHPESYQPSTSSFNPDAHQQHSNADEKSGKRKSQTESTSKAAKRIKPGNDDKNHQDEEAGTQKIVTLEVNCTEPGCKTTLNSRSMWKKHLSSCHGKIAYKQLKDNVRHKPHGQTEHACTDCQAVYISQHSLHEHWIRYHQAGKFECSVCGFVANLSFEVINHQKKDHTEKKYECTFEGCNKSFRSNHDLELHSLDHNGERPYSCAWDNCELTFKKHSSAIRHVRTQHFKLPRTVKEQQELNIIEERDPQVYVRRSSN